MALRRAGFLALVSVLATVGGLFGGSHAVASGETYSIAGNGSHLYSPSRIAFNLSDCDPSVAAGPLNGVSSLIVDVSAWQGSVVAVSWSAETSVPGVSGLSVTAFRSAPGCQRDLFGFDAIDQSGSFQFPVGAGIRWLSLNPNFAAGVTVTLGT